jgi:MFS transporter, PPP family, 3-phenylpropionic acid transporter
LSATAQGLNAVLFGAVLAVSTAGSGLLWSYGLAFAYLAMAVLAALGFICARPKGRSQPDDMADILTASGAE